MFKIYAKNDEISKLVKQQVISYLESNNYIISKINYDYVITIGGDGTFLGAINNEIAQVQNLTFIPINTGHLGFYTEQKVDFKKIIANLKQNFYDEYHMLELKTNHQTFYALNEFYIQSLSKTIIFDYYVDGEHLQKLRGGGVIVASPQGSTAIAKSHNGAVMYPNSNTYQIIEVGSVNNSMYRTLNSNLILPNQTTFKLKINEPELVNLNYDTNYNIKVSHELDFKISSKKIKVMHLQKSTFTKRIKDGFIK